MQSVHQARNRLQTLASIAVHTISDQYRDKPEFLTSLEVENLSSCVGVASFREEFIRILTILHQNPPESVEQVSTTGMRMAEIKEYIVANYTDNEMNVTSIAKKFDYSVSYLSRSFKDVYNINLLEFIQRMRVNHAKELLPTHSVRSVAQQTGFWDEQALVRVFRKYEGISPAEFKKLAAHH